MGLTLGHVKWFIDVGESAATEGFSFSETAVLAWIGIVIALTFTAGILDRFLQEPPKKYLKKIDQKEPLAIRVFEILIGISLLAAATRGIILVPHYTSTDATLLLRGAEAVVAILLIINRWITLASGLLTIIYMGSLFCFGFFELADYINFMGIALFLLIKKSPSKKSFFHAYNEWALPLLRVFTGIALLVLAFSEKLVHPEKAAVLLEKFNLNFMTMMGFENYSDRLFILSAGSMEVVFALIFIVGFIPRLNTLALGGFLIASNIYFAITGHPEEALTEIIGHLPILATALILLLYGAGDKLKLRLTTR